MKTTKVESIELSWLERFGRGGGFGYRINGRDWLAGAELAGATPPSDSITHMAEAVVAIAFGHGLEIRTDQVWVNGLNAGFDV